MGKITSGYVLYGRTLNLGDYNSKKAEVQISFESDQGDHDAMLKLAGTTAISKVHELLALAEKPKAAEATPAPAATGPSKADLEKQAKAAAGATTEPPKTKAPPKTPPKAVKQEPAKTEADEITDEPVVDSASDDMTDILGGDEPKPDVTDEELTTKVTRKAAESKNTKAIRELVATYAGPVPNGVRQVPKEKRHEFLAKLAEIKAPA